MLIKVLDKATMGSDLDFNILSPIGSLEIYDYTTEDELIDRIRDAEVIIINKVKITAAVLKNAAKLKLVCVFATGYDNIDVSAAKTHGIAVSNVPAYSTDSVATFTLATVLSLITHLSTYRDFVATGDYSSSKAPNRITPVYHELSGKCWGIVGYGNIGKKIGKIAEAFGARVIVNKRTPTSEAKCVDLETLCRESDIITVHCPLNEQTRSLIGEKELSLMKSSVILVNEARGAVLDESAVARAVTDGKIAAFGADVYSKEPFDKNHPFYAIKSLDNVVLTPHAAWAAYEARVRCLEIIKTNIEAFIKCEIKNRVDI